MIFIALPVFGQSANNQHISSKVTSQEVQLKDIVAFLSAQNDYLFSFDLSSIDPDKYSFGVSVEEYLDGKKIDDISYSLAVSRKSEGVGYGDLGIYAQAVDNGKLLVTYNLHDFFNLTLPLETKNYIDGPQKGEVANYNAQVVELPSSFEENNGVISVPLVLYGAFWYDSEAECYRLCGSVSQSPHYYKIGIYFTNKR